MKLLLWISLPLFIADQVTKYLIVENYDPPTQYYVDEDPVIDGFFYIHRVHNTGVAFGTFNNSPWANYVFGFVASCALIALLYFYRKNAFPTRIGKLSVALLVPGILGNLCDRIVYGYVVDFLSFDLHFKLPPWAASTRFASFNIADACICVAAVLLFITAWQTPPDEEDEESGAKKSKSS